MLVLETTNGFDWNDAYLAVEPAGRFYKVTYFAPDPTWNQAHFKKHPYNNFGQVYDFLGPDGAVIKKDFTWGDSILVPSGVQSSDYGINLDFDHVDAKTNLSSRKLLFVEASKPVVDLVGASATDSWPSVAEARHRELMNVLFADGHLESFPLDAIDPRVKSVQDDYWRVSDVP